MVLNNTAVLLFGGSRVDWLIGRAHTEALDLNQCVDAFGWRAPRPTTTDRVTQERIGETNSAIVARLIEEDHASNFQR